MIAVTITVSLLQTFKAFRQSSGGLPQSLELAEEKMPSYLSPQKVLICIHAVSQLQGGRNDEWGLSCSGD